jgi:F420-0:gamma-glutamyl ligase-like protein
MIKDYQRQNIYPVFRKFAQEEKIIEEFFNKLS